MFRRSKRSATTSIRTSIFPSRASTTCAVKRFVRLAPIRTALRTGDTPQSERQRMTREPPHILVTTPESLYILLTAAGRVKC